MQRPSHLLIIGAMKAGTTSLFDLLATHPELSPSITKEPEFFSENQGHKFNVSSYDELWPKGSDADGMIRLEASTGYTGYPYETGVPRRIFEAEIEPKFIYIVRNPFDRIESQINWAARYHWFQPDIEHWDEFYIRTTMYATQLDQYEEHFDREDFLILDFDDLKVRPEKICAEVSKFLAIDNKFDPSVFNQISNKTRPETKLQRFVLRNKTRRSLFFKLPFLARETLKKKIFPLSKDVPKIALSQNDKKQIRNIIEDDMIELQNKYGVDTSKWGF